MKSVGARQVGVFGALALAVAGCNSFEPKSQESEHDGHLVIPVDERAAVASPVPMRPISGGTLSVLADGSALVAADPERDRVSVIDLTNLTLRASIALEPGDEPGRSIEDAARRVHVALRGGGAVVTIDPRSGTIIERRPVCKAPRGLAFEPSTELLHVACSEGKLVSLPAAGGAAVRTLSLEPDLRDVIVRSGELWVSTFRSAQLLRVSATDGAARGRVVISQGVSTLTQPSGQGDFNNDVKQVVVDPAVAWRTVGSPDGGAVLVHQHAVVDEVEVPEPTQGGSAYGGSALGLGCDGLVRNAITTVSPEGDVTTTTITGAPLPVDVAISPDRQWVAVAHAGLADPLAPRPFVDFPDDFGADSGQPSFGGPASFLSSLAIHGLGSLTSGATSCSFPNPVAVTDTVTAVTFSGSRLIAQSQEPARVHVFDDVFGAATIIDLPGESRVDTGHDLFHRDSGGGIACASCHPEGSEDGRVWRFADVGARRTQPLNVGLEGTAPFHWAGDLPSVGSLMTAVFVERMGGVRQSDARLETLNDWLFSLKAPPAVRDASDEAAVRGRELFDSAEVGCASCHSGAKLTNNQTVAIDSLAPIKTQVPSLVGVAYRAPYMHTGCAATLLDRFDPACGGNAHGNTAQLSDAEKADLVAYMESL